MMSVTKEFYPIKEGVLDVVHQILDLENLTEVDMQIRINQDGIPTVDAQIKMIAPSKQRIIERRTVMYSQINFKTKKAFREAVEGGEKVRLFAPWLGEPKTNGTEYVEGPHYPAPHTWWAEVHMVDGFVTKVK